LPKQLYGTWCLVPGKHSRDGYVRENCVYEKNGEIIVRGGVRKGNPDPNATFSYGEDMRQGATDLQAVEIGPKFFGLIEYEGHEPASRTRCKVLSTQSGPYGDWLVKMECPGDEGPLYDNVKEYWLTMEGSKLYVRFWASHNTGVERDNPAYRR
jgi:hypothetical protein